MGKNIIIIGEHPLADDLERQYEKRGDMVKRHQKLSADGIVMDDYDELCLLAGDNEDDKAIALLTELATTYDRAKHGDRRLLCHLLVQHNRTLQMLLSTDFCEAIRQNIDVYPFTMDDVWSQRIVLDYEPITIQSEKHVHLVVFGMTEISEMVAIKAALTAHYPNYTRNHTLRTRITMIDEQAEQHSERLFSNYRHLFHNSYYRMVDLGDGKSSRAEGAEGGTAVTKFHKPMYEGRREDFVDVEWEFVVANAWNVDLREKLQLWAKDERQLLTIVMADKDKDKNVNNAMLLPDEVYRQLTPIYIYSEKEVVVRGCPNLHGFGMRDQGYDVSLPLVRMAKNINYVYDQCYKENIESWSGQLRYAVEINAEERDRQWNKLSTVKRMSNIYNAMTVATKMRSIGLGESDWEQFYDIAQQDIEVLAQVEHNRWNVEELILGYRPCTDEEQRYVEENVKDRKGELKRQMTHYDLRAYSDLRADGTGKSVKVYDRCICASLPVIAKAFSDEKGGEA